MSERRRGIVHARQTSNPSGAERERRSAADENLGWPVESEGPTETTRLVVQTGEFSRHHYKARIDAADVWLSFGTFGTLCDLVHARLTSENGFVKLDKNAVRHLRNALNRVRTGLGHSLITSVPGPPKHCYALLAKRDQIRVDPSFEQVRLSNCVPKVILDALLELARDGC